MRIETDIQRIAGVPMEPRAALGAYDPATGRYTLYAGGGAVVRPKKELAIILGLEPEQVRVIAREIGGNFGTRNFLYPEFVLVAWAAKKVGRPVKWTCERGEAFASDYAAPRPAGRIGAGDIGRRPVPRPACDRDQQSSAPIPRRTSR